MKFILVALLSAAAVAVAEIHAPHGHAHFHASKLGSPIEARNPTAVTEVVQGAVVTVYVLNGKTIPDDDVEKGLKDGKYILIPESTSTSTSTTVAATTSTPAAPQFFQKTTTSVAPKSTTTSITPTTSSYPVGNIDADFPSGTIPCSQFPSSYGPIEVPWEGMGGWSSIQEVPNFDFGVDAAISYIVGGISGGACGPKSFCSYACPAGYQKSQWPDAQGSTGQSIGGLYCNADGMLELSRPSVPQLCITGVGGVQVKNKMSKNVCVCRTDYPASETETVPLDATPGGTFPLTCPDALTYYQWQGMHTSAQYYINPSGEPCSKACTWSYAGSNVGNWAPVNAGVGRGTDGVTYLSLFPNSPTNPDGKLDYNIKITGASGDCSYVGGEYYSNGVVSKTGCTVAAGSGGAIYEFSN